MHSNCSSASQLLHDTKVRQREVGKQAVWQAGELAGGWPGRMQAARAGWCTRRGCEACSRAEAGARDVGDAQAAQLLRAVQPVVVFLQQGGKGRSKG